MRIVVKCLLCKSLLRESSAPALFLHDPSETCAVRVTDRYGVSLDDKYEVEGETVYERVVAAPSDWTLDVAKLETLAVAKLEAIETALQPTAKPDFVINLEQIEPKNHEEAITELFTEHATPKLGGASGDAGWSSFFSFQRCPYLWYRSYVEGNRSFDHTALITGSLLHLFLALHYQCRIVPDYPITATIAYETLKAKHVHPEAIAAAWRLYDTYRVNYHDENGYLTPLAVEHHVVDPKTRQSCRYDLIVRVEEGAPAVLCAEATEDIHYPILRQLTPGAYVWEHKTTSRRDENALTGWVNDGEVIGQMMLWKRLGLDEQFGPLQGTIINLLGKQKSPSFDRVLVSVKEVRYQQHAKDLKVWQAFRQLCIAQESFPRARANCINRWGKCSQWEHCKNIEGRKDEAAHESGSEFAWLTKQRD